MWGYYAFTFAEARSSVMAGEGNTSRMHSWIGVPGLSAEALAMSLRYAPSTTTAAEKAAELETLLAVHPMSAENWLSLAGDRFVLGRPAEDANAALTMSRVVGPNEGTVAWQRAMFGLLQWNTLSVQQQFQTITDLAGAVMSQVPTDQGLALAKGMIQKQPAETQGQIADALQVAGLSLDQLAELGLHGGA